MIVLRVQPGLEATSALAEMKLMSLRFPGEHELVMLIAGLRLQIGSLWTFDASPACLAALGEFGRIEEPAC